jgi:hypothetical protein
MKRTNRKNARKDRPTLPELDQTKRSVLNSLTSLQSRRSYQHAMDEFIEWYCSEPRLALNRAVVLRYRLQLGGEEARCLNHQRPARCRPPTGLRGGRHGVAEPRTGRGHSTYQGSAVTRSARWQLAERCRGRAQTLTLPELDQSKNAVLNSLGSLQSTPFLPACDGETDT